MAYGILAGNKLHLSEIARSQKENITLKKTADRLSSILLSTGYQKHHADLDVGAIIELTLGQKTVTVTISGLFDVSKAANGHGALAMDSAARKKLSLWNTACRSWYPAAAILE